MIIGARLPHTGPRATAAAVVDAAVALESAGAGSLWVSDHIAQPLEIASHYPFAEDGVASWSTMNPDLESLTILAMVAARTERARLGTAILLAPLRLPVLAANLIASIDALAPGRMAVGLGVGWLKEEFAALGVPFAGRGHRLEEWIETVRECWTGTAGPSERELYPLPGPIVALPAPQAMIPLFTGGHSGPALRRAGRLADGWLGQQSALDLDLDSLASELRVVREAATAASRDPDAVSIVLRLVDSSADVDLVARVLPGLADLGVAEVILDTPADLDDSASAFAKYGRAIG